MAFLIRENRRHGPTGRTDEERGIQTDGQTDGVQRLMLPWWGPQLTNGDLTITASQASW